MRKWGIVMDLVDVAILASMGMLTVFFGYVAIVEWWDARESRSQQADAEVIQHPRSDRRINPAA
jgi:hypothetical protein